MNSDRYAENIVERLNECAGVWDGRLQENRPPAIGRDECLKISALCNEAAQLISETAGRAPRMTIDAAAGFLEHWILATIVERTPATYDPGQFFFGLNNFTDPGVFDRESVRGFLKDMRNRGLLVYGKGLMDEDGNPAGSGYTITPAGIERLKALGKRFFSPEGDQSNG